MKWQTKFDNNFTEFERDILLEVIKQYVPEEYIDTYNHWYFYKISGGYYLAKRDTWINHFILAESINGLRKKVHEYYLL